MTVMRALTWNVLADAYIRADWFPLADPALLAPGARQQAVLDLVAQLDADVVALQEVDLPLARAARDTWVGFEVLWAPKGRGKPDGCLTAVRRGLHVLEERRVEFADGTGNVVHLVRVATAAGALELANTHLRFAAADDPGHVGVRQIGQVLTELDGHTPAVVLMDSNDRPDGPVRAALRAAGFVEGQGSGPTNVVDGDRLEELDVIAARGARLAPVSTGLTAAAPLPSAVLPSDHLPLVAAITL